MGDIFRLNKDRTIELFGVPLAGLNAHTCWKVVLTVVFIALLWALGWLVKRLVRWELRGRGSRRASFWTYQTIQLILALLFVLAMVSIWFDTSTQLTTVFGIFSAGLAIALQKPITAFSAYFLILRGRTFNIGDRIVMGGVRGDVISVGFLQTKIMEMGQPPAEQSDEPTMWVRARQYTGRLVTVTNDKVFDEPVFNYTQEFPYIWEEMMLPVGYSADRNRAEEILLEVAKKHTSKMSEIGAEEFKELRRRYPVEVNDWEPKVYWRLTDNWLEMNVRFLTHARDVRALKDRMSRDILQALDEAHIGIPSSTYDIVGFPPLHIDNSDLEKLARMRSHNSATDSQPADR